MTTAGCEPQSRACDCHWKTAYWSTLAADRNHHTQTVLIGLKITVIIGFGCDLFVTRNTALHGPCAVDFSIIYHNGYKTPQQAETPSVTCMRYDSEWQYSGSHIVQLPVSWEWDLSEHVWLTLSSTVHRHQFVSAVGSQAQVSVSWL